MNDGGPLGSPIHRARERLLRKVLTLPNRPAAVWAGVLGVALAVLQRQARRCSGSGQMGWGRSGQRSRAARVALDVI